MNRMSLGEPRATCHSEGAKRPKNLCLEGICRARRSFVAPRPASLLSMTAQEPDPSSLALLRMTTCRAVLQCLSRKVTALLRMTVVSLEES